MNIAQNVSPKFCRIRELTHEPVSRSRVCRTDGPLPDEFCLGNSPNACREDTRIETNLDPRLSALQWSASLEGIATASIRGTHRTHIPHTYARRAHAYFSSRQLKNKRKNITIHHKIMYIYSERSEAQSIHKHTLTHTPTTPIGVHSTRGIVIATLCVLI